MATGPSHVHRLLQGTSEVVKVQLNNSIHHVIQTTFVQFLLTPWVSSCWLLLLISHFSLLVGIMVILDSLLQVKDHSVNSQSTHFYGRKVWLWYWIINTAAVMCSERIDWPASFNMTTPWRTDDIINIPQNIFDSWSKVIDSFGSLHLSAELDLLFVGSIWNTQDVCLDFFYNCESVVDFHYQESWWLNSLKQNIDTKPQSPGKCPCGDSWSI